MESATTLCGVSFRKNPRDGQRKAIKAAAEPARSSLNIQLPTGYGKTFVANAIYAVLRASGRVNRMLVIFPTEAQHEQYVAGAGSDLRDVSLPSHRVADMRFMSTARLLKAHRSDTHSIYATTVQSLIQPGGFSTVSELLEVGQWLIVVDEHHHYGLEKTWGQKVTKLNRQFLLAMSATPYRKDNDNAFGAPDITVTYRDAVAEGAVKPLRGHAYHYRLDLIDGRGEIQSVTPAELIDSAGGDSPELLRRITRDMRISPKYISPLVAEPLQRLLRQRLTKDPYLQAILGCMWVDHAKQVCTQVQAMFPELRVDWVGTGPDGRPDNKDVLSKFCPPKDPLTGLRPDPELDVLVHVGVAGEGLDTVLVSEIIHLNAATLSNQNNQENGRAARVLPNGKGPIIGNINFDSTSGYVNYTGKAIMGAMDMDPPRDDDDEESDDKIQDPLDDGDYDPLPEEPVLRLYDIELDHIDSGHPDVQPVKDMLTNPTSPFVQYPREALLDPSHQVHSDAVAFYKNMRKREAEQHDLRGQETLMRKHVSEALAALAGLVLKKQRSGGVTIEKSAPGDIKTRINKRKAKALGRVDDADGVSGLKAHYHWLRELEQEILDRGLPSWLK
jgi:superfamily II DNA or RNA helicase